MRVEQEIFLYNNENKMKNDSKEFMKNNNRQYLPLRGCFPFYLPMFLHFFHSRDGETRYF